jgi:hypothetical protein
MVVAPLQVTLYFFREPKSAINRLSQISAISPPILSDILCYKSISLW